MFFFGGPFPAAPRVIADAIPAIALCPFYKKRSGAERPATSQY